MTKSVTDFFASSRAGHVPDVQPRQIADGVRTTFAAPAFKSILPPQAYEVSIDGFTQSPTVSYYTNSLNEIKFYKAPPKGAAVDIVKRNVQHITPYGDASYLSIVPKGQTEAQRRSLVDAFESRVRYNVKDYGALGDGVTDDTAAFFTAVAAVNGTGGHLLIPEGKYLVKRNLRITKDNVIVSFDGEILLAESDQLTTEYSSAAFEVMANGVVINNFKMSAAKDTLRCVALRFGDNSYSSQTGRRVFGCILNGALVKGLGINGPGAGAIAWNATDYCYGYNCFTENCNATDMTINGGNFTIVQNCRSINNKQVAYYIGSQQPKSLESIDCAFINIKAIVNEKGTGTFCKVSRAARNCTIDNARFYAYGINGMTKVDEAYGQPALWMQSGIGTTFSNITIYLEDLTAQTTPPLGLYGHGNNSAPLYRALTDCVVDNVRIETKNCDNVPSLILMYAADGAGIDNMKIVNSTFKCSHQPPKTIHIYANDSGGGTFTDVVVTGNHFGDLNGVLAERGPASTADIGTLYIKDNIMASGKLEKNIKNGTDGFNGTEVGEVQINASSTITVPHVTESAYVQINPSADAVDIEAIANASDFNDGVTVLIQGRWNSTGTVTVKHNGSGKFKLEGNADFTLNSFSSIMLIKSGGDWVEISRRD